MTDRTMTLNLLPCPFCGGEAAIEQTGAKELTLRCVGVQPSGLRGCGPKFVQRVKTHSLEWLSGIMAERWNRRHQQSAAQHQLIGNLLDRWEMTPNDIKAEMREYGCGKQLDALLSNPSPTQSEEAP